MQRFVLLVFACCLLGLSAFGQAGNGNAAADELITLLPESDVVAVIDVNRAFNELLPRLKNLSVGGLGKTAAEIELFARLSGIDPAKIQAAVIGVKMTDTLSRGSGALLVQGVDTDVARLESLVKAAGGELRKLDHNGKQILTLLAKPKAEGAPPEEINVALLGNARMAVGDIPALKSVLDGGAKNSTTLAAAGKSLKETKATAMIRFAGNLPPSLRELLASQGELFAQVAAVKVIFGSLDFSKDLQGNLDAKLRTVSKDEATQLESGLKGLIFLGKSFLEGNNDPTMKMYSSLIDQAKIAVQGSDVTLSLVLPKELIEQLTKPGDGK